MNDQHKQQPDIIERPSRINVLFVCSMNQWRSPTAEKIYAKDQRIHVRSGGTSEKAARTVRSQDLKWADLVLVMEPKHRQRLVARFPGETRDKEIHVLEIPDEYQFMDEELVQILHQSVEPLLTEW